MNTVSNNIDEALHFLSNIDFKNFLYTTEEEKENAVPLTYEQRQDLYRRLDDINDRLKAVIDKLVGLVQ